MRWIVFVILATATSVFAQSTPPVQYTSGAQSQALGRTISTQPSNILDASFNPASLATFRDITTTISYASTRSGAQQLGFGVAIPIMQHGAIGLSYYGLRHDFRAFDENGRPTATQPYDLNTVVISYGWPFLKNLAVGFGAKFVHAEIGMSNSEPHDIGLSISAFYKLPLKSSLLRNFQIGFFVNNLVQPHMRISSGRKSLPREFRIVLEKSFNFANSEVNLINNIVKFDEQEVSELRNNREYYAYWGLQYSYRSTISLRAGLIEESFVWGSAIKLNSFMIDYAYGDYGEGLPRAFLFKHFVSVSVFID
ncbi:hypothetical protein GWO43_17270 [candidate division KSB1 bacterium]|nr:hypothetical protein [candidate division KSB1 bacterium]NIR71979.1 hypothetical protein [candidate division KSB1 bacterium]NIS24971.1 hypothetical protein [candidate division KSB1 bacterium]NIT72588.1 hypothetical protein [candidate division KSB1 bacterium]NIU25626.1 hypothetical protein [candidate division KSB1 bacterium]